MNEHYWMNFDDPKRMLDFLLKGPVLVSDKIVEARAECCTDRKLKLFAAGCADVLMASMPTGEWADTFVFMGPTWRDWAEPPPEKPKAETPAWMPVPMFQGKPYEPKKQPVMSAIDGARWWTGAKVGQHHEYRLDKPKKIAIANVLRDVFGNVFKPQEIESTRRKEGRVQFWKREWTEVKYREPWACHYNVLRMAFEIGRDQNFGEMRTLGLLMKEVGCKNEEILAHCLDESARHVRGCWVLDLLMG